MPPPTLEQEETTATTQTIRWISLAIFIGILIYVPSCFFGFYIRDEGRELTEANTVWWGHTPYSQGRILSYWLAGGWQHLTAYWGVVGSRLGTLLINLLMAAFSYPILRQFMSYHLTLLALTLTAIAGNTTYSFFLGYRNIPSLFLYIGLYYMYRSGLVNENNDSIKWYFIALSCICFGLASASKVTFIISAFFPLIPLLMALLLHHRFVLAKWLAGALCILISLTIWQSIITVLGEPPITKIVTNLAQGGYGSNILVTTWVQFQQAIVFSLYFIVLAAAIWYFVAIRINQIVYWSILGSTVVICYTLFDKNFAYYILAMSLIWNKDTHRWIRWFLLAIGCMIAHRYFGYLYLGGAFLFVLLRETGMAQRPWVLSALGGLTIWGAALLLDIKYHYLPFGVCFIILVGRILFATIFKATLNNSFLNWAALAVGAALTTMIGSKGVFYNYENALWILLPLACWGRASNAHTAENSTKYFASLFPFGMAALVFSLALTCNSIEDPRELPIWKLKSPIQATKLNYIVTSRGRANSIAGLIHQMEARGMQPYDLLLAYNHIPILYYATTTNPFFYEPWIDSIPLPLLSQLIEKRKNDGKLPTMVVRALTDTRSRWWGERSVPYQPHGNAIAIKEKLDDWCSEMNYKVVWNNRDFELLMR